MLKVGFPAHHGHCYKVKIPQNAGADTWAIGRPVNTPTTSPVFSMPGGGTPDVFGPQFGGGGNPAQFAGPPNQQYTLAAPPPGPTMEQFNEWQYGYQQM